MIRWNQPGRNDPGLTGPDGTGYKTGTGHRGTYLWVIEDANGMSAAYFYPPNGAQGRCLECGAATPACEEIAPLEPSKGKTYRTCVDHDQAEPCSDSRSSRSSSARAMLGRRMRSRRHIARIIEINHSSKSIISISSIPTERFRTRFGSMHCELCWSRWRIVFRAHATETFAGAIAWMWRGSKAGIPTPRTSARQGKPIVSPGGTGLRGAITTH
jgi:hypothetical protein